MITPPHLRRRHRSRPEPPGERPAEPVRCDHCGRPIEGALRARDDGAVLHPECELALRDASERR